MSTPGIYGFGWKDFGCRCRNKNLVTDVSKKRWVRWLGLLLIIAVVLAGKAGAILALDPMYYDVRRDYWGFPYINLLREEEVTDGHVAYTWWSGEWRQVYLFYPENEITRAEYALMIAKVFRLDPVETTTSYFLDVSPDLLLYSRIKALPWIEAVRLADIVRGTPQRLFYPRQSLERQAGVALLVRSLGLSAHAASLTPSQVDNILARFRDHRRIDNSLRNELALAVKLRIVVGYPDGTLRPTTPLKRSEAATLIYRAALCVLSASPNPFSPDGDGVEDTTAIVWKTLKNRNVIAWEAQVGTIEGRVLITLGRSRGAPPALTWDGRDAKDNLLPPGTYYYWGWVEDRLGQRFHSVQKPIVLERKGLRANLSPQVVQPGEGITVTAWTTGGASDVRGTGDRSPGVILAPTLPAGSDSNLWTGRFTVPPGTRPGSYALAVTARYRDGSRTVHLPYEVREEITLVPAIAPNPALAGANLTATAQTSRNVQTVTVTWPDGTSTLSADGDLRWHGDHTLPAAIAPGKYPVEFRAVTFSGLEKAVVVELVVNADPRAGLIFVLTG